MRYHSMVSRDFVALLFATQLGGEACECHPQRGGWKAVHAALGDGVVDESQVKKSYRNPANQNPEILY